MKKYLSLAALSLGTLIYSPLALAQQYEGRYDGGMVMNRGWGGLFFGPLMMIFWLGVAVLVVIFVVRLAGGGRHRHYHHKMHGPVGLLKTRLARGEISKEEYEELKKILEE